MRIANMPTSKPATARRRGKKLLGAAGLALGTALSSGCSTTTATSDVDVASHHHALRHPILISNEPEVLDMPVGMRGPALSPQIETAVRDYVRDYQADGTGSITIQTPTAAANEVASASSGRAVHYALVRAGVPRNQIQVVPYYFGDHSKVAPLRISYLRVKAVVPSCGQWPETRPNSSQNTQLHNFGCASQQNLAAMVENPADLIRPRPMTPANSPRREAVLELYIEKGHQGWDPEPWKGLGGSALGAL